MLQAHASPRTQTYTPLHPPTLAHTKTTTKNSFRQAVQGLRFAGVDLVTLANNHMMDFGLSGLQSTLNALSENNITYTGISSPLKKHGLRTKPSLKLKLPSSKIVEIKGIKFAFVSVCALVWCDQAREKYGFGPTMVRRRER
eukprot:m.215288 g.215288  ORF g.215288 m.215288 type:complete len:142 (+) comp26205_c0_seq1:599-1024(+)